MLHVGLIKNFLRKDWRRKREWYQRSHRLYMRLGLADSRKEGSWLPYCMKCFFSSAWRCLSCMQINTPLSVERAVCGSGAESYRFKYGRSTCTASFHGSPNAAVCAHWKWVGHMTTFFVLRPSWSYRIMITLKRLLAPIPKFKLHRQLIRCYREWSWCPWLIDKDNLYGHG
jgi:hypothetical protein